MGQLRFIGDVHGDYARYLELIADAGRTLQIGDMGFDYGPLAGIDPARHAFFPGNHDNHEPGPDHWSCCPIAVRDDFGIAEIPDFPPVFYLRGAWSIDGGPRRDAERRTGLKTWWADEELSDLRMGQAEDLYARKKPDVVATHEGPFSLVPFVTDPSFPLAFGFPQGPIATRTSLFLDRLLAIHRPRLWVFGHYHPPRRWDRTIEGTRFVCLTPVHRPAAPADCTLDVSYDAADGTIACG